MDICKCNGNNCPVKEECFRFTAPASEFRQSYFLSSPIKTTEDGGLDCEHYWGEGEPFKKLNSQQ